jgi:hypothetical protein
VKSYLHGPRNQKARPSPPVCRETLNESSLATRFHSKNSYQSQILNLRVVIPTDAHNREILMLIHNTPGRRRHSSSEVFWLTAAKYRRSLLSLLLYLSELPQSPTERDDNSSRDARCGAKTTSGTAKAPVFFSIPIHLVVVLPFSRMTWRCLPEPNATRRRRTVAQASSL